MYIAHQGRITSREWRDFEVRFKMAMRKVSDANDGEAHRLLMDRLPNFMVGWVVAETAKLPPCAVMHIQGEYDIEALRAAVQSMAGVTPKEIEAKGLGKYLVSFSSQEAMHKFLLCNGRKVRNSERTIAISQHQQMLSCERIFRVIERKLEIEGQQALYTENRNFRGPRSVNSTEMDRPATPQSDRGSESNQTPTLKGREGQAWSFPIPKAQTKGKFSWPKARGGE